MQYTLVVTQYAQRELEAAIDYIGLDNKASALELTREVPRYYRMLQDNPFMAPVVYKRSFRQLIIVGFPYSFIYRIVEEYVVVHAFKHHKQSDKDWKKRTS